MRVYAEPGCHVLVSLGDGVGGVGLGVIRGLAAAEDEQVF